MIIKKAVVRNNNFRILLLFLLLLLITKANAVFVFNTELVPAKMESASHYTSADPDYEVTALDSEYPGAPLITDSQATAKTLLAMKLPSTIVAATGENFVATGGATFYIVIQVSPKEAPTGKKLPLKFQPNYKYHDTLPLKEGHSIDIDPGKNSAFWSVMRKGNEFVYTLQVLVQRQSDQGERGSGFTSNDFDEFLMTKPTAPKSKLISLARATMQFFVSAAPEDSPKTFKDLLNHLEIASGEDDRSKDIIIDMRTALTIKTVSQPEERVIEQPKSSGQHLTYRERAVEAELQPLNPEVAMDISEPAVSVQPEAPTPKQTRYQLKIMRTGEFLLNMLIAHYLTQFEGAEESGKQRYISYLLSLTDSDIRQSIDSLFKNKKDKVLDGVEAIMQQTGILHDHQVSETKSVSSIESLKDLAKAIAVNASVNTGITGKINKAVFKKKSNPETVINDFISGFGTTGIQAEDASTSTSEPTSTTRSEFIQPVLLTLMLIPESVDSATPETDPTFTVNNTPFTFQHELCSFWPDRDTSLSVTVRTDMGAEFTKDLNTLNLYPKNYECGSRVCNSHAIGQRFDGITGILQSNNRLINRPVFAEINEHSKMELYVEEGNTLSIHCYDLVMMPGIQSTYLPASAVTSEPTSSIEEHAPLAPERLRLSVPKLSFNFMQFDGWGKGYIEAEMLPEERWHNGSMALSLDEEGYLLLHVFVPDDRPYHHNNTEQRLTRQLLLLHLWRRTCLGCDCLDERNERCCSAWVRDISRANIAGLQVKVELSGSDRESDVSIPPESVHEITAQEMINRSNFSAPITIKTNINKEAISKLLQKSTANTIDLFISFPDGSF